MSKTTTALAPWYGSNRMLGSEVGLELGKLDWVGIPFAGGMSELLHIKARGMLVNDLHRDVINLARVVKDDEFFKWFVDEAADAPFHPDVLANAQAELREWGKPPGIHYIDAQRALKYFICCWMGRSALPGTGAEYHGNLAVRYTASGGGSNVRYRSAIDSLTAFHTVLQAAEFTVEDFSEFLEKCHDRAGHGIYVDAPWPDDGDGYQHRFTVNDHHELAGMLQRFKLTRVVVRFGDHPLIRELYSGWNWRMLTSRTQANGAKAEALILNGPSYAG